MLARHFLVRHALAFNLGPLVGVDLRLIGRRDVLHTIHNLGFVVLTFVNELFHRLR